MPITPTITRPQNSLVIRRYTAHAMTSFIGRMANYDYIAHSIVLEPLGTDLIPLVLAEIQSATSTITQTISFPDGENIAIPLYCFGAPKPLASNGSIIQPNDISFRRADNSITDLISEGALVTNVGDAGELYKIIYYGLENENNGPLFTPVLPEYENLPAITSVVWNVSNPAKMRIIPSTTSYNPVEGSNFKVRIAAIDGVTFTPNELVGTVQGTIVVAGQTLLTNVVNVYAPPSGVVVGIINPIVTKQLNQSSNVLINNTLYSTDNVNWTSLGATATLNKNTLYYFRGTFINNNGFGKACSIQTPSGTQSSFVGGYKTQTITASCNSGETDFTVTYNF